MATHTSSPKDQPTTIYMLPHDVLLEVFSHLSQQDSLVCMDVCYDWYYTVLMVASDIWKKIRFTDKDLNCDYFHGKMSLVKHIRHVTFESTAALQSFSPYILRGLLQKLVQWRCTDLESLGKTDNCIENMSIFANPSVEFIGCDGQRFLIDNLRNLSRRLTHIKMIDHRSSVSFASLTLACPELTHFTYHHANSTGNWLVDKEYGVDQMDHCSKITHLQLDVVFSGQAILGSILKRCPELRCLIVANRSEVRNTMFASPLINLDSLFNWCPNITTLVTTNGPLYKLDGFYTSFSNYDTYDTGLRHFIADVDYGSDQISRHLSSNQNTLEYLHISKRRLDRSWSNALRALRMSQLRTFSCHAGVHIASLITMLNHCPALETLSIQDKNLTIDSTAVRSLKPMHRLSHLSLTSVTLDEDLLTILERFPMLEELVMDRAVVFTASHGELGRLAHLKALKLQRIVWDHGSNPETEVAFILGRLVVGSRLISVDLLDLTNIGDQALEMLMPIPTLKCVGVPFTVLDQERFIKMLNVIEDLSLYSVDFLSLSALDALGDLPLLRQLDVHEGDRPVSVSKEGLLLMLHKSSSLRNVSFKKVRVEDGDDLLSYEELVAAIRGQVPQYKVAGYEYKSPILSSERRRVLTITSIKRVSL